MSDKLMQIARLVCDQTRTGDIKWESTPEANTFQTSFPTYSILIQDRGGLAVLKICNEEGHVIEELADTQGSESGLNLRDLYVTARRAATDVEQALDDILKTLGGKSD
jgi:hypothetical protein